jgi:hypothetical protein
MAEPDVKIELAADLERARGRLARNFGVLRHDLDVGTHLKESFHQNKAAYISGATFLGLLLSWLPARRKKVYVARKAKEGIKEVEKAGIWLVLLQFVFNAVRPMLTSLISKQLTDFVRTRGRGRDEA